MADTFIATCPFCSQKSEHALHKDPTPPVVAEPTNPQIEAVADKLQAIGNYHRWWVRFDWRDADRIGREEFLGICEELVRVIAALK